MDESLFNTKEKTFKDVLNRMVMTIDTWGAPEIIFLKLFKCYLSEHVTYYFSSVSR